MTAELAAEEIRIHTSRPGHPLLVKVSYHPRWRVEGADIVWLASPSFMLVVPTQEEVRLVYGITGAERLGGALTALALVGMVLAGIEAGTRKRRKAGAALERGGDHPGDRLLPSAARRAAAGFLDAVFRRRRWWAPVLVAALGLGALAVRFAWTDPWIPHRQGLELFQDEQYEASEALFLRSMAAAPSSAAAYYSDYYFCLSAYRTQRWEEALGRFGDFVRTYPDGELVSEAHFRMAEALQGVGRPDDAIARFLRILDEFPTSRWAGFATERLTAAVAAAGSGPASSAPRVR